MESNFHFLTGAAGTGKSYNLALKKQAAEERNENFILTATTGIAAINLGPGTTTINSVLKFYDYESLKSAYDKGWLQKRLRRMNGTLVIDEVSMLGASTLDLIMKAHEEVNFVGSPLKILLVGDFMQLPPVKADIGPYKKSVGFCFESPYWKNFEVEKLTKIYRQSDPIFLSLMQSARSGNGEQFAQILSDDDRITKLVEPSYEFDGTTIFSTNAEVEAYNKIRLAGLKSEECTIENKRWGKQPAEWKEIPETIVIPKGAQIMTLANGPELKYVNGSQGMLLGWDKQKGANRLTICLADGTEVDVNKVVRRNYDAELYDEASSGYVDRPTVPDQQAYETEDNYMKRLASYTLQDQRKRGPGKPYFDFQKEKWVVGEIYYMPIKVAYALTVHKTQGLTLDRVQVCPTNNFFAGPSMMYVAVSRCKTPEGLTIVGNAERWEGMCNISDKVVEWI